VAEEGREEEEDVLTQWGATLVMKIREDRGEKKRRGELGSRVRAPCSFSSSSEKKRGRKKKEGEEEEAEKKQLGASSRPSSGRAHGRARGELTAPLKSGAHGRDGGSHVSPPAGISG